jgi:hypothetical protein
LYRILHTESLNRKKCSMVINRNVLINVNIQIAPIVCEVF